MPSSWRIGTVQSADLPRGAIARDADRTRHQKSRDAAVESRSGGHKFIGLDPLSDSRSRLSAMGPDGAREGDITTCRASRLEWRLAARQTRSRRHAAGGLVLAADGPDVSRVFVLPLPVDRQRYVRGIEFRANNPRIHHANIRIDATPASRELDEQDAVPGYDGIILRSAVYPDGHFLGWTPGQAAPFCPRGLRGRWHPGAILSCSCTWCRAASQSTFSPPSASTSPTIRRARTPVMMRLSDQRIDIPAGQGTTSRLIRLCCRSTSRCSQSSRTHTTWRASISGTATLPDGTIERSSRLPTGISGGSTSIAISTPVHCRRARPSACSTDTTTPQRTPESRRAAGARAVGTAVARRNGRLVAAGRDEDARRAATARPGVPRKVDGDRCRRPRVAHSTRSRSRVLRDDIAVLYMELNRPSDAVPHFEASLKLTRLGRRAFQLRHGTHGRRAAEEAVAHTSARSRCGPTTQLRTTTWEPRCFNLGVRRPRLRRSERRRGWIRAWAKPT